MARTAMARTVEDCALMLDCLAGFDPKDDYTSYAATSLAMGLPKGGSYAADLSVETIEFTLGVDVSRFDRIEFIHLKVELATPRCIG